MLVSVFVDVHVHVSERSRVCMNIHVCGGVSEWVDVCIDV